MGKFLPPRKINVQKFAESRASELEALHSIVANRLDNDFRCQRNKRRRTTSFDNQAARKGFRRKKQKLGLFGGARAELSFDEDQKKKLPRRIRRKRELRENPNSGFITSGDGTKRLRTHVWHAKRFTMTKLWGFYIPMGVHGRGKGSKALLKRFKQGVLLHDASYYGAIQLEGPEESLVSILRKVMVPSPLVGAALPCDSYASAMLCQVGSPVSQTIAPVTYMWRPICHRDMNNELVEKSMRENNQPDSVECCQQNANNEFTEDYVDRSKKLEAAQSCPFTRQLWVWIHPSAFNDGYNALTLACQQEIDERGVAVSCLSLEGQLGKLELIGSGSFQLLQKVLYPVMCVSQNCWQLGKHADLKEEPDSQYKRSLILKTEEHISSSAVLSLTVGDPRILPKGEASVLPESTSTCAPGDVQVAEENVSLVLQGTLDKDKDQMLSSYSNHERHGGLFNNHDLWDVTKGVSPPMEETSLCKEKHQQRASLFCLDDPNSGKPNTSLDEHFSRSCPILVLKNNKQNGLLIGFSIVLPMSWVKAFWMPLVSNGAHAIGLREKHWVACEMGLPFFPSDFPDCYAYSCFMETKAAASDQESALRPPTKRPLRVPVLPPWHSVRFAFTKEPVANGDSQISPKENMTNGNLFSDSVCRSFDHSYVHDGVLFDGIVARTGGMLIDFLNEIQAFQSLLFPRLADRKSSISKHIKDERKFGADQDRAYHLSHDRKLCFVRVHLHAFKEGFFEDGSVICAPRLTDISIWTSSSEVKEAGLQMPQSAVGSYFKELSSSKWDIQIPEDPISNETHRWPIGFVTTGFVRGSKKLVAEGFCEALLLACLREEQWNEIPAKRRRREIYVLIRNLRSTSYRLALASIILESQEEDVLFM